MCFKLYCILESQWLIHGDGIKYYFCDSEVGLSMGESEELWRGISGVAVSLCGCAAYRQVRRYAMACAAGYYQVVAIC